jgi:hypothetical protein
MLGGLFAAPIAWSLQLLVSYGLTGDRCRTASSPGLSSGSSAVLQAVIGVIAVVVCALALLSAWRVWRMTREEGPGRHHEALTAGHGRTRFLGLCGIIASLTFLAASVFELIVPFLVSPCALPFL